jgi:outer membrane lipopolysaccharide assembly protein LptE/RlpB
MLTAGCGYHTAGHAVQLPENVKTIAVPAFKNETLTYRIEQMLTASVVREFTTRTHYRILNDSSEDADATLIGTVLSTTASPLTYDTATGRAASVLVVVSVKVVRSPTATARCSTRIRRICFANSTRSRRI